ncbi:MAG: twin-arginine translocation signal domain-containing protein, partial [Anaerolineae bacterium]|nr:twin-arginine translocation signal domain-containing protein [Anaerolineae bacterium]
MNRRQFLGLAGAGAAAVVAGAGWATLIEPNWPVVERHEITLARLPARLDGLRIAQLSDIHLSPLVTAGDLLRA